jgi:hypothetical protein
MDADAELFVQLPVERLERSFSLFDFATGEFPGTGQVAPGSASCKKNAAAGVGQDTRNDVHGISQTSCP